MRISVVSLITLAALALVACSSENGPQQQAESQPPAPSPAAPPQQQAESRPPAPAPAIVTPPVPEHSGPVIEVRALSDWYHVALIDQAMIDDPSELEDLARPICEGTGVCQVGFWFDARKAPRQMPVDKSQLDFQIFSFGRRNDGSESVLWNCNLFREFEEKHACLPRQIVGGMPGVR